MDELIGRLARKAGIGDAVAEETVGIIPGFLRDEGPSDKVQALIDGIPDAEAVIVATWGIGEIHDVARELFRFGHDKIGADRIGEIVAGTPGLSQFA